jgi:HEPN domain-containing protein
MGDECPTDTVCFHAQQCIEKYLKALLTYKDISFPKTHDIEALVVSLPNSLRPNLNDKEQSQLADYAAVTRYPGDFIERGAKGCCNGTTHSWGDSKTSPETSS